MIFDIFIGSSFLLGLFMIYNSKTVFLLIDLYILQNKWLNVSTNNTKLNPAAVKEDKYEDKYLNKIKLMLNKYSFTNDELVLIQEKMVEKKQELTNQQELIIKNLIEQKQELTNVQTNGTFLEHYKYLYATDYDEGDEEEAIEKFKSYIIADMAKIDNQLLIPFTTNETLLLEETENIVKDITAEKLLNNYVFECTPLGNVCMRYNNWKKSFEYYSDKSIPYKYLEVVGRKYVYTFKCRHLFVDEEDTKLKSNVDTTNTNKLTKQASKQLRNTLNELKQTSKQHLNTSSNTRTMLKPLKVDAILNINKNRYTCAGKISNISLLKKPSEQKEQKVLSYSDFKKIKKII